MDTRRLILFVFFSMAVLLLWDVWRGKMVKQPTVFSRIETVHNEQPSPTHRLEKGQRIVVHTDVYQAELDSKGGDLRRLVLNTQQDDQGNPFVLMRDDAKDGLYIAQTGLLGQYLPDHNAEFSSATKNYQMAPQQNTLEVKLQYQSESGVAVDKIYTFYRGSHLIELRYVITNNTLAKLMPTVYYQIIHDDQSNQSNSFVPNFTGVAYFTEDSKFKKRAFDDIDKEPLNFIASDGWVGLLQHYFVSAWILAPQLQRNFYSQKLDAHLFSIGVKTRLPDIATGAKIQLPTARLFAGPQIQSELKKVAPGLKYSVDYGWLTLIASPLFWLLSWIQKWVHNWGVAIILLTLLIKLAFYKLSATSYRSMAQMRELAPRLQALKERFGNDRQKMQLAVMELYKTENVNPVSGCLPIILQIPVFIAFYWMLLASVELRHAPFFGWITDLSVQDPYFVLPALMTATMVIQSRLNPKPPDPLQAKLMIWMPLIFSIFFFFFPAGLVLYWLTNNILSIAQQWYMTLQLKPTGAAITKR